MAKIAGIRRFRGWHAFCDMLGETGLRKVLTMARSLCIFEMNGFTGSVKNPCNDGSQTPRKRVPNDGFPGSVKTCLISYF